MILPFNNYDLLLLADWLEEFGSCYDIVKSTAIRNNNYNLNFKDNCYDIYHGAGDKDGVGYGMASGFAYGWGWGSGSGYGKGEGHERKING